MNPLLLAYCERTATDLVASIWHGALVFAVVAVALRLLPRLSAAVRSLIWTVALVLVVALPFLSAQSAQVFPHILDRGHTLHLDPVWSLAIAAVWLVFSLVRAAQLLVSASRLHAISVQAELIEGIPAACVRTPLGVQREASLCLSDEVARPSVIGFFAPRILIPRDLYPKLSAEEIDQVILHEMEHLRRGDDWRNLLQKFAVMLFPLNPALHWIERRLCFERELACDESVLAHTHAPKSYAACLVHLAEERSFGRQISLALGAWERRSELGRRVHDILANRTPAPSRIRTACASFVTVVMVASAFLLAKTPQLISFTDAAAPVVATSTPVVVPQPQIAKLRMNSANQPRMIDTMMHVSPPVPGTTRIKHRRPTSPRLNRLAILNAQSRPPQPPAPQPRVVLASWTYSDGIHTVRVQRVVYAVFEVPSRAQTFSSETAQPLSGGLFFLQL